MNASNAQKHPKSWVRTLQRKLYCAAKGVLGRRFGVLKDKVTALESLNEAWKRVSKNGGAPGIDRQGVREIKEYGVCEFLGELQRDLKEDNYKANVIRRVYIAKGENAVRPLGIPTMKDRVTQMAVKLIIEPIFEAGFQDCSHGFRPKRDNKEAAKLAHKYSNTYKWIVDVDLKSYFDTIDHDILMELLRKRISDARILYLVKEWLKAGIMEKGEITKPEKGTPQGGVLSPLLSNIYLNEIDKLWHDNPSVKLVRFADDMVFLCKSKVQAEFVLRKLRSQLEKLKLTLNEDKTKIRHVQESFDFIGFTYREAYSERQKRMVVVKYPRAKSMKKICDNIKQLLKTIPNGTALREVIKEVNPKLRGWAEYFKIGNSYREALKLSQYSCEQLRIYWRRHKARKNRRSYKKWPDKYFYQGGLLYVPYLIKA
ncbi:MAG: group II intron reverse transcriptase/maturase [Lentisphaerae bacterium GWF2_44_16]|nr:MAG: group II intron reverse transcriptase/maturase [Lentisphaerae bacterium GWF2_44_16]